MPTPEEITLTSNTFLPSTALSAWIKDAKHAGAAMQAEASTPVTTNVIVTSVITMDVDGVGDGDAVAVAEREGAVATP